MGVGRGHPTPLFPLVWLWSLIPQQVDMGKVMYRGGWKDWIKVTENQGKPGGTFNKEITREVHGSTFSYSLIQAP